MIITQYAEDKLADFARRVKNAATNWQVLHYHNPEFEGNYNDPARLQITMNVLEGKLPEEDVQLYFCTNGDIYITAYGADGETIKNLRTHIETSFAGQGGQHKVEVFDLAHQLGNFTDLVDTAVEAEHLRRHAAEMNGKEGDVRKVNVSIDYAKDMLAKRPYRTGMHILVVEDDPFTLKLIGNVLEEHTVIKAMDGIDAVESYMLNAPDMVFLDINLPSISGHEVLKKIKEFDADAHVVMLSGNRSMQDVSNALHEGAKGYVAKPFPKDKLLNCVKICQTNKSSGNAA